MNHIVINVERDKLVQFISDNIESFSDSWKVSTSGIYSWVTVGPLANMDLDDLIDSIQYSEIIGYKVVKDNPTQGTVFSL